MYTIQTKMMISLTNRYVFCCRHFSKTCSLNSKKKKYVRYRSALQEPYSERSDMQRLSNKGKKLIPFDKNLQITGKNTGRHVEGGSHYGAKLAAKHDVPMYGYINLHGRFIHVPKMRPNFVVPDLTGFKLQPYVSYRTAEVNQTTFTAEDLYKAVYRKELEEDLMQIEQGKPLEEVISERMEKFDKTDSDQQGINSAEHNTSSGENTEKEKLLENTEKEKLLN